MREQTENVLDDWVHAPSQRKKPEKKEKDLKSVINNETIPYSYVNYIYHEKNWKCPVCGVDDGHYGHLHYMMCKELHPKD